MPVVSGRLSLPYATAIALLIEALLLAALVIGLSDAKKTTPPRPQPVMLSFPVIQAAPPKPTPTPPHKPPVKPVPHPRPAPVHHTVHHLSPPVHKTEVSEPAPEPLAMAPAAPDTVSAPPQPAPFSRLKNPAHPVSTLTSRPASRIRFAAPFSRRCVIRMPLSSPTSRGARRYLSNIWTAG